MFWNHVPLVSTSQYATTSTRAIGLDRINGSVDSVHAGDDSKVLNENFSHPCSSNKVKKVYFGLTKIRRLCLSPTLV